VLQTLAKKRERWEVFGELKGIDALVLRAREAAHPVVRLELPNALREPLVGTMTE
jgi:hypothetical protein